MSWFLTTYLVLNVSGARVNRNPACNNLCSKCFRDIQAEAQRGKANEFAAAAAMQAAQQQVHDSQQAAAAGTAQQPSHPVVSTPASEQPAMEVTMPASHPALPAPLSASLPAPEPLEAESVVNTEASSPAVASSSDAPDERPVQKNISRCWSCKKKIGLTGFKCRCGYVFCGTHRYAEAHACDFDHKALGREILTKNNPLVQASLISSVLLLCLLITHRVAKQELWSDCLTNIHGVCKQR